MVNEPLTSFFLRFRPAAVKRALANGEERRRAKHEAAGRNPPPFRLSCEGVEWLVPFLAPILSYRTRWRARYIGDWPNSAAFREA